MKILLTPTNKFFIAVTGIVVIFIVLKALSTVFIPLIVSMFLFFAFSPMNNYLAGKKISSIVIILIDIVILLALIALFSTIIVDSFTRLGEQLPQYEEKLTQIIISTSADWGLTKFEGFSIANLVKSINLELLVSNIFSSTFSVLGTLTFVLFFFIFVVSGYKDIYNVIKRRYLTNSNSEYFEETTSEELRIKETFEEITGKIQRYIFTKFVISLFSAITTAIILWLFGVDFYIVWAVLTFLLNFIPNIGSIIAIILPSMMALVQFESPGYALLVLVVLTVIDLMSGYYVEPRIFGSELGLNPLVILLSLLLWGYIWGITGILLSVPITASIKIIISRSQSPSLQLLNDLMSG